ncbi:hypothetical protein [Botrimarina hoheduenensis]|uniref:Uncharacterized protein n=1 Tax=Botrimarina hoheduenensis TaxID=2528000 RepID=A0A5C5VVT9_9BACT|nr:hypothetical protein [Botrimarina hoheduenensis]TWT42704.1 hypothetical protein Pla111_26770 [Botrimarina hoheduenensis]
MSPLRFVSAARLAAATFSPLEPWRIDDRPTVAVLDLANDSPPLAASRLAALAAGIGPWLALHGELALMVATGPHAPTAAASRFATALSEVAGDPLLGVLRGENLVEGFEEFLAAGVGFAHYQTQALLANDPRLPLAGWRSTPPGPVVAALQSPVRCLFGRGLDATAVGAAAAESAIGGENLATERVCRAIELAHRAFQDHETEGMLHDDQPSTDLAEPPAGDPPPTNAPAETVPVCFALDEGYALDVPLPVSEPLKQRLASIAATGVTWHPLPNSAGLRLSAPQRKPLQQTAQRLDLFAPAGTFALPLEGLITRRTATWRSHAPRVLLEQLLPLGVDCRPASRWRDEHALS